MNPSKSQRILRLNPRYTQLSLNNPNDPISNKHPSSFLLLNFGNNNKSSNNKLSLASTSYNINELNKKRIYDNIHVFYKRQYAFNKSIEANKKVFKYTNFSLFNEKNKTSRNKRYLRSKKIDKNPVIDFSKFFLTDNGNLLPILNSKSINNDIIEKYNNIVNKPKKRNRILDKMNYIIKQKSTPEFKDNINKKQNIYTNIKNSELVPKIYINNLKDCITNKLHFITREEKLRILNENKQEKLQKINSTIFSLKNDYSHFENTFYHKFCQYIREIHNVKEEEKEKDDICVNILLKLRQTVNNLKSVVKKIETNKNSLNHWMYLQICMKERKLYLPQSYIDILEANYNDDEALIKKYGEDLVNRVKKYKNKILFDSVEDFLNQFDLYEDKNLKLLNKYHIIRTQIRDLENEKNKVKRFYNLEEYDKEYNELINKKMKELNRLKNENINLIEYRSTLISQNKKSKNMDNNITKKRSKLYIKTQRIVININKFINIPFQNNVVNPSDKTISDQQLILFNLSKIERIIDLLIKKNESLKELYPEKMVEVKLVLDKEKKYLKNLESINNIKLKFEEERKKIIKKYEKILILPTHKINMYNLGNKKDNNIERNNKKLSKKKNKTIEDIDDYFNE